MISSERRMSERRDDRSTDAGSASMTPTLDQIAAEAKERARTILKQLRDVVSTSDSVALLATLSSLRLTHAQGKEPDVDAFARWQTKLEFLTWFLASTPSATTGSGTIDATSIARVEELLEQYFNNESLAVAGWDGEADREVRSLLRGLLLETMHVRGEGTPEMVRFLARGIYSAHDEWFRENLGFTCEEAITIAKEIVSLHADRLAEAYRRGHVAAAAIEVQWRTATELAVDVRLPEETALVDAVEMRGLDWVTNCVGGTETFSRMREVHGFTVEELSAAVPSAIRERVAAFVQFFSQEFGTLSGTPSLIDFNPLVRSPLLFESGRYFLFVPPLLWEAILNAPHYALLADAQYRPIYDDTRAAWLEQQATEAFRHLWPDAQIGWSLTYGPKGQRSELDGLVFWGRKAVIIECKWKSLTLMACRGDSDALRRDVTESILKAFKQGERARDYICATPAPEFTLPDGSVLKFDSRTVNEIVILSVLGRGALSIIATNPLEARALGLFKDNELPWALSLFDLLAVCRTMEFGGQFFDYARRRAVVIADKRFHFHDEWDLLEFYFAGALDPKDPEFEDKHRVMFTGSGRELERLVLDPSATVPESLRRRIHPKVRRFMTKLDRLPDAEAADAVAFLLGLSDRQLQQMGDYWIQVEEKTKADGKLHSMSGLPTPGGGGFTIVCSRETRDDSRRLEFLCLLNKYKHHAPTWLGIRARPGGEDEPFVVSFDSRPDKLLPLWPPPSG